MVISCIEVGVLRPRVIRPGRGETNNRPIEQSKLVLLCGSHFEGWPFRRTWLRGRCWNLTDWHSFKHRWWLYWTYFAVHWLCWKPNRPMFYAYDRFFQLHYLLLVYQRNCCNPSLLIFNIQRKAKYRYMTFFDILIFFVLLLIFPFVGPGWVIVWPTPRYQAFLWHD